MKYPPSDVRRSHRSLGKMSRTWQPLYTKEKAERRFNSWNWTLHYLGVVRVVYDTERKQWTIKTCPWNPALWVFFALVTLYMGVWKAGFSTVIEEIRSGNSLPQNVLVRRDDGAYRFLSYRRAFDL